MSPTGNRPVAPTAAVSAGRPYPRDRAVPNAYPSPPLLVRDFIVFEDDSSGRLVKKMAGYHQFHAVRVVVQETLRAAADAGRWTTEAALGRRIVTV